MCSPKLLCLPPVANTLRDLDMRFTWVYIEKVNMARKYHIHTLQLNLGHHVEETKNNSSRKTADILGNPGVTHSVPTAFINAVGTEWVTP